jgi:tetratricopeptide (TPR) repeat protein
VSHQITFRSLVQRVPFGDNEAIRLKPDFSRAFTLRGRARQEMGDLDRAIRDLNEALRVKPDSHEVFYYRANIFEQKSQFDAAVADYEKYLDLTGEQNWCLEKNRDLKAKL